MNSLIPDLDHAEVSTVAGMLLAESGMMPGIGDRIEVDGVTLAAEEVQSMKITRVRLNRRSAAHRKGEKV